MSQLLRLCHLWILKVFFYYWLLPHVFYWTRRWDFRISELASSVSLWLLLLATMHTSYVDCQAYLLGYLLWELLCQVTGAEYFYHKYFVDFHLCLYLYFLLECVWFFACVILFGMDWNIWIFCVGFILSDNEWHVKYVFDLPMCVINIFGWDGVWTFINLFIEWSWLIVVSAGWLASQDFYLVRRT